MAKRGNKKTLAADPIELAVRVVQAVAEVVTDPEPLDALPPADFVPEVAPAPAALPAQATKAPRKTGRGARKAAGGQAERRSRGRHR